MLQRDSNLCIYEFISYILLIIKDIELQRWLSEINIDTRKDANQGNKMRTYRLFKTIQM